MVEWQGNGFYWREWICNPPEGSTAPREDFSSWVLVKEIDADRLMYRKVREKQGKRWL
jgi:hypothetical protein